MDGMFTFFVDTIILQYLKECYKVSKIQYLKECYKVSKIQYLKECYKV